MGKQANTRDFQLHVDPQHGGYSDIRLWPCYLVLSALILFLSPRIGMVVSMVIIGFPAFVIAKIIAAKQPAQQYDSYRWLKDVEQAMKQKNLRPLPELKDYEIKTAANMQGADTPKKAVRNTKTVTRISDGLLFSKP